MTRALGSILLLVAVGLLGARRAGADVTIHAVGRVVYENPRGELVDADNIQVWIDEEAWGVDLCLNSRLGSDYTDQDGYFDFTVVYSPGLFCGDPDPDIRLRVGASFIQTGITPNFPGGTIDLHEVDLEAGYYQIRLENLSSAADLGLSIHPPEVGVMSRIDALPNGAAWLQVAGEDEQIVLEIPATGLYCIAVWKAGPSSLPVSADYNLVFNEVTAAQETPVTATPLMAAYPNPFASQTVISFDLPKAGPATLDVFDIRGRRVRRLVGEDRSAGPQEVAWDGRDEAGQPAASGIYMVRLAAEGASRVTRIALTR